MSYVSSRATPNLSSGGSGEINDGVNVGAGEGAVFKDKVGVDLRFRTLKQGSNVVITENADEIEIASTDTGEVNTGSNVGAGEGTVFKDKTGVTLNFKSLKQGANIVITNNANEIEIAGTGGGSGLSQQEVQKLVGFGF